jgi:hypothetical protein
MRKKYCIRLLPEERTELEKLTRKAKIAAPKVIKARALLLCDQSEQGPGWTDAQVLEALGMADSTLERLRERCCEVGPLQALDRKAQGKPSREKKITGDVEAHLTTLACSEPPAGCARWTLHLLAERLVELKVIESISHESVRQTLKKTNSSPG